MFFVCLSFLLEIFTEKIKKHQEKAIQGHTLKWILIKADLLFKIDIVKIEEHYHIVTFALYFSHL